MDQFIKSMVKSCGHMARNEWRQGNHGRGTAMCMIGIGLLTLPIPIIGVPLIIGGIIKYCRN